MRAVPSEGGREGAKGREVAEDISRVRGPLIGMTNANAYLANHKYSLLICTYACDTKYRHLEGPNDTKY